MGLEEADDLYRAAQALRAGHFQNENSVVTARITREEYYTAQGERLVEDAFDGSLPAFVAAFTARKALSAEEVAALREMIDAYGKES